MKRITSLVAVLLFFNMAYSQQPLPDFSVVERGNKVIISWVNPFETIIQLNVQRSYDSLKYYRTIYSATSPELPQNGFSEPKQQFNKTYYRIFFVLKGGAYFFTPAKLATPDTDSRTINLLSNSTIKTFSTISVTNRGALLTTIPGNLFPQFKDSILRQTKDTLFAVNDSLVELRRFVGKEFWKASIYIFTSKEGYLNINLWDAAEKKYHIKFFEEDGNELFEIKHIKDKHLSLDKSNFVHAGWFSFELYEDNKLREKNKFYLPKDF